MFFLIDYLARDMKLRTLSGALILLLLSTPLTAALCGDCSTDACPMMGMKVGGTEMQVDPQDETLQKAIDDTAAGAGGQIVSGHCGQTQAVETSADAAVPTVASGASVTIASDGAMECCATATAPEIERPQVLTPSSAAAADGAHQSLAIADVESSRQLRGTALRLKPPLPPSQPLYTLHSLLLI